MMPPSKKRVTVTMTAREAKTLEQYAALMETTPGDVMLHFAKVGLAQQRTICKKVDQVLAMNEVPLDHRLEKTCFGPACLCCVHRTECLEGQYSGLYVWNRESMGEFQFTEGAEPPEWVLEGIERSKK